MLLTAEMARGGRVALYLGKHAIEQNSMGVLNGQGLVALTSLAQLLLLSLRTRKPGAEGDHNTSQAKTSPTGHSLTAPEKSKQSSGTNRSSDHQAKQGNKPFPRSIQETQTAIQEQN